LVSHKVAKKLQTIILDRPKTGVSAKLLRRFPLFAGLNEKELREINSIASLVWAGKGHILFSDSEEALGLYVLISGKVKLHKVSHEGKEQILDVICSPESFGEASLFLKGSHPFYAETLNDCQLLFFTKKDFLRLIKKISRLNGNVTVALSLYVKRYASLIEALFLKAVSSRIAKYLIDLSFKQSKEAKNPDVVEIDLNRSQLASRLGTVRETLSKNLLKMKAMGIIEVKRNRILILDRKALEKLASGLKL